MKIYEHEISVKMRVDCTHVGREVSSVSYAKRGSSNVHKKWLPWRQRVGDFSICVQLPTSLASLLYRNRSVSLSLFIPTLSLSSLQITFELQPGMRIFMRSFMPTRVLKIILYQNANGLTSMTDRCPRYVLVTSRLIFF